MVRVNRSGNEGGLTPPNIGRRDEMGRVQPGRFEADLVKKQGELSEIRMQEILKEIDQVAARLAQSLTIADLMLFRRLIKDFLREATSRAFRIRKERGSLRRQGRSLLITIEETDREIEELIEGLIRCQDQPVGVLETLDKIRGMLVDLMA